MSDPRDWMMFPFEDGERQALDYVASALQQGIRLGVLTRALELLVLQGPVRQANRPTGKASHDAPAESAPVEAAREEVT